MGKLIAGVLIGAASMFVALYAEGQRKKRQADQRARYDHDRSKQETSKPKATPSEKVPSDDVEETVQTIITPSPVVEDENGTKDQ